jgi:hypothetical protein
MTCDATRPVAQLAGISVDCADPVALAEFYLAFLGGQTLGRSPDSVGIGVPGAGLAMQRVAGYRPPSGPGRCRRNTKRNRGGGFCLTPLVTRSASRP